MSYLTLNGVVIPVALDGTTKSTDTVGAGITRAADASARNNFNAKKWHWKGKTTPLLQTEALFIRALLEGLGDRWTWDSDLYSDKGVAVNSNAGGSVVTTSPTPKRGAGCLSLISGTGAIRYLVDPAGSGNQGWTAFFWESPTTTAWDRYVYTVDYSGAATVYKNGSAGSLPSGVGVSMDQSGTRLSVTNTSGAAVGIDDLLYVPAYLPPTLFSGIDTFFNSNAWPAPFPQLTLGGDVHPLALSVLGRTGDGEVVEVTLSGSLQDNAVVLPIELLQV